MSNVNSDFVVTDVSTAGALSYWRLSGPLDGNALRAAWVAAGLDADWLPAPPTATVALARTLTSYAGVSRVDGVRCERRAVKVRGNNEWAGGWILTDLRTHDGHVEPHELLHARLDASDTLIVEVSPDVSFDLADFRARFDRESAALAPTDVSNWLIRLAGRLDAVSLRDRGGIYFLPRTQVELWERIVATVEAVSAGAYQVFRIPALQTKDAVQAILDALEHEAIDTIQAFEAAISATGDAALGPRALATKQRQAAALAEKLGRYEALLGTKLDVIRQTLELTQANLAAAVLAAEAEAEAARNAA